MSLSHPLSHKKRLTKDDLKKYPILVGQYSYLKDSFDGVKVIP